MFAPLFLREFRFLLLAAAAFTFHGCGREAKTPPPDAVSPHISGIQEPSGVLRLDAHLYFVGDDDHGSYFDFTLTPEEAVIETGSRRIPIDPMRLRRIQVPPEDCANDLEGICLLADGRIGVLSEERRALYDEGGIIAFYGRSLSELGSRGMEGCAVYNGPEDSSKVAILWEGGYVEDEDLPLPVRSKFAGLAMHPFVLVHDLAAGERRKRIREGDAALVIELDVPLPAGVEPAAQRFRAPDLVWHELTKGDRNDLGFIVLLSSGSAGPAAPGSIEECPKGENGIPLRYCYKWLQRFRIDGTRVGEPYDLDQAFPEELRSANWEGMGWYETGVSLVLVYEESFHEGRPDLQEAIVIPLPEGW